MVNDALPSLAEEPAPPGELDEVSLARARKGDRAALAAFVRRYERPVYALVGRMLVGRGDEVEDVAQDVFVRALQALPRFDPRGRARLSTWLLTIATRRCIDVLRRPRAVPVAEVPEVLAPSTEAEVGARLLRQRIELAMADLPADQRAVLVLRAYHDLDYAEVARAVDVSVGTVKSRLSRARAALRSTLEEA